MKIEVQRLLDSWEETEIQLTEPIDPGRLQAKVKAKIAPATRKRHPIRRFVIAAAAALLLMGGAFAVFYQLSIADVQPELVKAPDDSEVIGDEDLYWVGADHELRYQVTGQGNVTGFRCSYLPASDGEIHASSLREYLEDPAAFPNQAGGSSEEPAAADWEDAYICYLAETVVDGRYRQQYRIDIYQSNILAAATFAIRGEVSGQKRRSIGSFEALSFTLDASEAVGAVRDGQEELWSPEEPPSNHILLFDQTHECLVHIYGDTITPMEELERIAEGITLVVTDVPAAETGDPVPEAVWICNARG